MEEQLQMGRRTVGGLILTRAGSILVYRDEKETPNHNNTNKRNHESAKKCRQGHQKRSPEPSRRTSCPGTGSNPETTRGRNVNLAAKINKRVSGSITRTVSQIQGSLTLRGKNGISSSSNSTSSSNSNSNNNSIVRRRQNERIIIGGGNGDDHGSSFRINNGTRRAPPPYYGRNGSGSLRTSAEDDVTYWSFNIDESTERFLEQETSSFLDDRSWPDRHREMRMDIDDMSYEELLAFCERIGTVNTGLSDAALSECLERSLYVQTSCSNLFGTKEEGDFKCIVCQEEYKFGEEVAKLSCSHYYHVNCIHQWLRLKNWCPICKALASPSTT